MVSCEKRRKPVCIMDLSLILVSWLMQNHSNSGEMTSAIFDIFPRPDRKCFNQLTKNGINSNSDKGFRDKNTLTKMCYARVSALLKRGEKRRSQKYWCKEDNLCQNVNR